MASEKEIAWDLSEIYAEYNDPKITTTMDDLKKQTDNFVNEYKGKIHTPDFTAQNLYDLFKQQEKFFADLAELSMYGNRLFDANMTIPAHETLKNNMRISSDSSILNGRSLSWSEYC